MPSRADAPEKPPKRQGPEPLRRRRVQTTSFAPSQNRRRILNLLLGFAAVVLLVDALVGEKGFVQRMRAGQDYARTAAKLETIRSENNRLREDIRRLKTDADAIEELAREQLGLIKPGEVVFILRDTKPVAREAAPAAIH